MPQIIGLAELLDNRAPAAVEQILFAAAVGASDPTVISDGDRVFEPAIQRGQLRCRTCGLPVAASVAAIRAHRCH